LTDNQQAAEKGGMPAQGDSALGDRLHVCVGYSCNNNCIFCMESDRDTRFLRLKAQTPEDVRRMMTLDPDAREVMFTSGEPTLHPQLPEYIRMARDIGFPTVGLITNGRRLAYKPYARELLEAGLNHLLVSVHGPNARVHDMLTRSKGSFAQALAGLANMASMRDEFPGLMVHTSYVVNTYNYKYFSEFFDAMRPLRVDQHVFNVMMPDGRGSQNIDTLMARYRDIAEAFRAFSAGLSTEGLSKVFLLDIPYCTTTGLPDQVRGYVERYFHYETGGTVSFGNSGAEQARPGNDGTLMQLSALAGEGSDYDRVAKGVHDAMLRVKRDECAACGFETVCRGVFRSYIERWGWDEFQPVRKDASQGA
jgi:cyclic pyranopterin phosphate synthase